MADYRDSSAYRRIRSVHEPSAPVRARRSGEPIHIERTDPQPGHIVLGNASRPAVHFGEAVARGA